MTIQSMETTTPTAPPVDPTTDPSSALSRRGFLRTAALTGGGLVAVSVAACAPAATGAGWTAGPGLPSTAPGAPSASAGAATASPSMDHASPTPGASAAPSGSPTPSASIPPGWSEHDVQAKLQVERFLDGEWDTLPAPNVPLEPRIDGVTKVFEH